MQGDRQPASIRHGHDLGAHATLRRTDGRSTAFRGYERAVNECFREVDPALLQQGRCEGMEYPLQHACPHPLLEATVACLVGRVAVGQIPPACAGLEHPENPGPPDYQSAAH